MNRAMFQRRAVQGLSRVFYRNRGLPEIGAELGGRYKLLGVVGQGGAGVVFRGEDLALQLPVAVKVLGKRFLGFQSEGEDLKREARLTLRLTHPRIVRTYTWEEFEGWQAVVMEWVGGGSVLGRQRQSVQERLPAAEVVQLGLEVLDALDYAHELGIYHNDLKPQNILLDERARAKLCDFGLAGRVLVEGDVVMGTPSTIAPERIRGGSGSPESDVYGLGATLWQVASGYPPYGYGEAALDGHLRGTLPDAPAMPAALREVLQIALQKDPRARFQDAASMRSALRDARSRVLAEVRPREVLDGPSPSVPVVDASISPSAAPQGSAGPRAGMVVIPARSIPEGRQRFTVEAFAMDVQPVTCRAYQRFVRAKSAALPLGWPDRGDLEAEALDLPVTGISQAEAAAYAAWVGKRLPTSLEWQAAARANPNGSAVPFDGSCEEACACPAHGATGVMPVGAHPAGTSMDGVEDLYGNVWEWSVPDPRDPPGSPTHGTVFGGSWKDACYARLGHVPRMDVAADHRRLDVGFRCVMSVSGLDR